MTTEHDLMSYNSPCKLQFAFNNSDFHEGVSLNLLQMMLEANLSPTKQGIPLHLAVSVLEPGVEVEISKRCLYFDDWEMIPKEPFMFK